jgi:hypothetical protein
MCWRRILKYSESEKQHPRYKDFLLYQQFVIFSMWNIMQVHLRDSSGFRRALEERGQRPKIQWSDVDVSKYTSLLKDFCEMDGAMGEN